MYVCVSVYVCISVYFFSFIRKLYIYLGFLFQCFGQKLQSKVLFLISKVKYLVLHC